MFKPLYYLFFIITFIYTNECIADIERQRYAMPESSCSADNIRSNAELRKRLSADKKLCDLSMVNANFSKLDLSNIVLENSSLPNAIFHESTLYEANMFGASLQYSDFSSAKLQNADLHLTDLRGSNLTFARLQGANLTNAKLGLAPNGKCTNISEAVFVGTFCTQDYSKNETTCDKEKLYANLEGAKGIKDLCYSYHKQPSALPTTLIPLRSHMRTNGLEKEAREITYIIEHGKIIEATYSQSFLEKLRAKIKYYLFDVTVQFGVKPIVAIQLLTYIFTISCFVYFIYLIAFVNKINLAGQLYIIQPRIQLKPANKNYLQNEGETVVREFGQWLNNSNHSKYIIFTLIVIHSIWLSLLSTFHIGWRDMKLGTWLTKMQPTEFTYKPHGLLRIIVGLQSITSMYLIAIYFLANYTLLWG